RQGNATKSRSSRRRQSVSALWSRCETSNLQSAPTRQPCPNSKRVRSARSALLMIPNRLTADRFLTILDRNDGASKLRPASPKKDGGSTNDRCLEGRADVSVATESRSVGIMLVHKDGIAGGSKC